ncbi:hypothetical protein KFL_002290040 [Klebsormidium nitens]|uniref:Expansin-like EG45 domain-containing protein n=1 Tax=Klebsormidium nitens TaxID=105231 RepID=A0A1Y1I490_KLENI|nr:hypothetical protein KFL_002290040 [Klebsormidium nitens]|eukprot:GAQ85313.1 hypothetical protein KFL_002290040 [Klebsormidium nitens]
MLNGNGLWRRKRERTYRGLRLFAAQTVGGLRRRQLLEPRYLRNSYAEGKAYTNMKFSRSRSMATAVVALTCLFSLAAARPLDVSSSRHLLQDGVCPPQMTQCFTTPYQAQYFCCDSSANLQCSGGPDFQCSNYIDSSAPLVPASLIPVVPGLATPAPTAAARAASASIPSPTDGPSNPSPTNGPSNPSPTNGPSNPSPTNPPSNPSTTNPPNNPAPTNPPNNPAPTNPPNNPAPTNPPSTPAPAQDSSSGGGGFRPGFATWYTDPNNANYFRTACYYNNPEQKPANNMIVALPPHIFGVGPGAGNGPGCGTYWEVKCVGTLKRIGDGLYPGNERGACATDKSIIVKGGDLCPECDEPRNDICQAADQPYCPGPGGYSSGQPGEHLDLALAAFQVIGNNPPVTGIIKILFRQVGAVPDSQLGVPF